MNCIVYEYSRMVTSCIFGNYRVKPIFKEDNIHGNVVKGNIMVAVTSREVITRTPEPYSITTIALVLIDCCLRFDPINMVFLFLPFLF